MTVVFTEKCCSGCGKITWDTTTGGYSGETHEDDKGRTVKCDSNGEVRNWDEKNNRVW